MYALVSRAARRGLAGDPTEGEAKLRARTTGIRGETLAYWYLRRCGYVFVARNYAAQGLKGELDLVGYDRGVLAFVEVKTRSRDLAAASAPAPEEAVNREKQRLLRRMAGQFLREHRISGKAFRFDVLAIEAERGAQPALRLTKNAF
jgi:putative endonuclease